MRLMYALFIAYELWSIVRWCGAFAAIDDDHAVCNQPRIARNKFEIQRIFGGLLIIFVTSTINFRCLLFCEHFARLLWRWIFPFECETILDLFIIFVGYFWNFRHEMIHNQIKRIHSVMNDRYLMYLVSLNLTSFDMTSISLVLTKVG